MTIISSRELSSVGWDNA